MPWTAKPLKVWTGSAWVAKPVKAWSGSAWVDKSAGVKVWSAAAGPSYIFQANLSGANGANVVAGTNNSFNGQFSGGTGGSNVYDTTMSVPRGTNNAMKITTASTTSSGVNIRYDNVALTFPTTYQGFWFRMASVPTANQYLFQGGAPTGGATLIQQLQLLTTAKLRVRDNFGAGGGLHDVAMTTVLAANTWYWIETYFSTPAQQMQVRLYSSTGTLLETSALGTFTSTPATTSMFWGMQTAQAFTGWLAGIVVSDTTWVGFPP